MPLSKRSFPLNGAPTGIGSIAHGGDGSLYVTLYKPDHQVLRARLNTDIKPVGDGTSYVLSADVEMGQGGYALWDNLPGSINVAVHFDPLLPEASASVATPGAIVGATTKLSVARDWARQFARNAGESVYEPQAIDRAIQLVGNRFCRETQCLRAFATKTLTPDSAIVDLSTITDFRPDRLLSAFVAGYECPLSRIGYDELWRSAVADDTAGAIEAIAFRDNATCHLWRKPDATPRDLEVHYWRPFTSWNAGDNSNPTLNIPDDYLYEMLAYGVPAILQHTDPEHAYASDSWQRYLDYENRMKGRDHLAVRVVHRRKSAD